MRNTLSAVILGGEKGRVRSTRCRIERRNYRGTGGTSLYIALVAMVKIRSHCNLGMEFHVSESTDKINFPEKKNFLKFYLFPKSF